MVVIGNTTEGNALAHGPAKRKWCEERRAVSRCAYQMHFFGSKA